MIKIIDNQELKLEYKKGFGAWTYHLRIPGTANIEGKWGFLKVSGTIDGYEIKSINLAPRKNEDKIIRLLGVLSLRTGSEWKYYQTRSSHSGLV